MIVPGGRRVSIRHQVRVTLCRTWISGTLAAACLAWATAGAVTPEPVALPPIPMLLGGGSAPVGPEDRVRFQLSNLPLAFEPSADDGPASYPFVARGAGYAIHIASTEVLLVLRQGAAPPAPGDAAVSRAGADRRRSRAAPAGLSLVRLRLAGARQGVPLTGVEPLPGRVNHLVGNNPAAWRTHLQPWSRVEAREVYPGVDAVFYGRERRLEYDLVVAPGASAEVIQLQFDGVDRLELDPAGDLLLHTPGGTLRQHRPVAYQDTVAGRHAVEASYLLAGARDVRFTVGEYDPRHPLVIDPVLSYSTFLGGHFADQGWDIKVDALGRAYVCGETESPSLNSDPNLLVLNTNSFQPHFGGGVFTIGGDAFVGRLRADGSAFEYLTYLGGFQVDGAFSLALNAAGQPTLGGFTSSQNFPVTSNAWRRILTGTPSPITGLMPLDGFVTRLSADGSALDFSTYLGGAGVEQVIAIALDGQSDVWAAGDLSGTNVILDSGPEVFYGPLGGTRDGFVAKVSNNGSSVTRLVRIGGTGFDTAEGVALDAAGRVYVAGITASSELLATPGAFQRTNAGGFDAHVLALEPDGTNLVYSTYLGGEGTDYAYRLTVSPAGAALIVGDTDSTNFPVAAALQSTNAGFNDGFVTRLAPDGGSLQFSTYFGGAGRDAIWAVAVDDAGYIHLGGESSSVTFPGISSNSLYFGNSGGFDVMLARLEPSGTQVVDSTFFGGSFNDFAYGLAPGLSGAIHVTGRTESRDLVITTNNAAQLYYGGGVSDGFVFKVDYSSLLQALRVAEGLALSWSGLPDTATLQATPSLTAPITWTNVPTAQTGTNGQVSVVLPLGDAGGFFRLLHGP